MDGQIARIGRDIDWRRGRQIIGHGKARPVRHQANQLLDAKLTQGREVSIELQLDDTPRIGVHGTQMRRHNRSDMAILLLEMLRPKKHAFAPRYSSILGHWVYSLMPLEWRAWVSTLFPGV